MVIIHNRNTHTHTHTVVYLCFFEAVSSSNPGRIFIPKITGKQNKQPQVKSVVVLFSMLIEEPS